MGSIIMQHDTTRYLFLEERIHPPYLKGRVKLHIHYLSPLGEEWREEGRENGRSEGLEG